MEITVDTEQNKIVVTLDRWHQTAVIISKEDGTVIPCSVPELIGALQDIAKKEQPHGT